MQKVEPDEAIEPAVSAEKIDGDGALIVVVVEVVDEKLGVLGVLDTGVICYLLLIKSSSLTLI